MKTKRSEVSAVAKTSPGEVSAVAKTSPGEVSAGLGRNVVKKSVAKTKVNFNDYELVDKLDQEEKEIWNELQHGNYKSIMTTKLKYIVVDLVKTSFNKF
jgi:hypothetical protein